MTEELRYKVGDKVWIEAEVCTVDAGDEIKLPYQLKSGYRGLGWYTEEDIQKHNHTGLPPKPKIPQAVMDWYEEYENERADWRISDWLSDINTLEGMDDWLYGENHLHNQHALATLIAYGPEAVEVEKEKRYRVYLVGVKNQWNQRQCLTNNEDNYFFSGRCMVDTTYTKQEIIKAGFGDVFDNPMFEVEEVE